jgi:hypothetical protein
MNSSIKMNRKEKFILYGALILTGTAVLIDVLAQWYEKKEKGEKLTWENYNGRRTIKWALLGLGAGAGAGFLYYEYKISEESKHPFHADEYLNKVLQEEHLKSDPLFFDSVISLRQKIKEDISKEFNPKLAASPENAGSFIKRTAIASNYDLDIILPFKKDSYGSLKEMYNDVLDRLTSLYGNKVQITKQTKAIGLTFIHKNQPISFDIVPGREICDYRNTKELNLYVRPDWFWQQGSSFKTNVDIQRRVTINKPEARKVIKLLKRYRDKNNLNLPTVIIEQCATDAVSEDMYGINYSGTENLLNGMHYIARKLENKTLIDAANSNNNLHDKMNDYEKAFVSIRLQSDIKKIESNPRYIREII